MEPSNNDKGTVTLSQSTIITLGVLMAVVFLVGVGVAFVILGPNPSPTPISENTNQPQDKDWPTTAPTFTPIPSPTPASTPTFTPTPAPTPTPTPIVVGWRELGYLTTSEFTGVLPVDYTRERQFLPDERILLKVVGRIQTGINLSRVEDSDVKINGTSVEVSLPRAEVTSIDLLLEQTEIYNRGWFPAEGLETEALDKGRAELEQWAIREGNLLELSEKLGQVQLENFLRKLGFKEIIITFEEKRGF
jgi:hypothetical protein